MSLKGKLVLITGCSGGIGSATALTLARQGASIAVHYNSHPEKAEKLVAQLEKENVRAMAFQADLADYDNVRRLHKEVTEKLGHPGILFNNAGATGKVIGQMGDIQDVGIEEFERTWKINTGSSYLVN
ncbi:hypothetical protein V5O48_007965 [Marasmius crinis-equi]|uniref:Uncharacterized protein n=1 Tax=Marasmius crinis-equi TaxID=585013 RepID=A0ABR3FFY7_9AGAR